MNTLNIDSIMVINGFLTYRDLLCLTQTTQYINSKKQHLMTTNGELISLSKYYNIQPHDARKLLIMLSLSRLIQKYRFD